MFCGVNEVVIGQHLNQKLPRNTRMPLVLINSFNELIRCKGSGKSVDSVTVP